MHHLVHGDEGLRRLDCEAESARAAGPHRRKLTMRPRTREQPRRGGIAVGPGEVVLLLALGLILYGDALELPFYSDDPVHMRWVERCTLAQIWTSAEGVGNYRPLPFTVWWADRWLAGGFHAPLEHAVNVVLHILNALLVISLTRRILSLRSPRWVGLAAGALFVTYPFSYQAIPWVGSLTHPLATFVILGSVLLAARAGPGGRWYIRTGSLALAVVALFAHESSLVIGGLVACLALSSGQRPHRRELAWPLAYLGLAVAFLPVYFSVPRQASPPPPLTLTRLTRNTAYVVQGLAYPFAPSARLLMTRLGYSDLTSSYLMAGLTLALLLLLAWRGTRLREMGLAIAWFAIAIVPASLMLSYDYILNGPRVLYLASVGAAIAWAIALGVLASVGRRWMRAISTAASLFGLLAILGFSVGFVRERQAINRMGGNLIWQLTDTFSTTPADERYLIVNFPAWLAPGHRVYPLGHEGTEFVAGYVSISGMVRAHSGAKPDIRTAKFSNSLPPWPGYFYGVRGPEVTWKGLARRIRRADRVFVVHMNPDGPRMVTAGRLVEDAPAATAPIAGFDGRVWLQAGQAAPAADATVSVYLAWRSDGPLDDADYRVFVHAYDEVGNVVAQADGYPLDGLYPFWVWRPGERVDELRYLRLDGAFDTSTLRVSVGIYDAASGERLIATDADGQRFVLDAVPIAAGSMHGLVGD